MTPSDPPDPSRDALRADAVPSPVQAAPVPALRPPSPANAPAGRRRVWLWLSGGLIAGAAAVLLYLQPWANAPIGVTVEPVTPAPITRVLAVNGRIAAQHSVDLRPQVSGTLTDVDVAEGDTVEADQILARIDTTAQEAITRQAVAALDAALVAQDQADATYARSLALGANISDATLEADRRTAQSAMQEVARLTALLDQAQIQLARHSLSAPIAGRIIAIDAEVGQNVDTSTVLLTLADVTDLIVETDVDESYASQIATGQSAVLQLAGETALRGGQVRRVAGRVDETTGGLEVQIGFDDPVSAPIGLTVTANIVVDHRDAALSVPRTALISEGGEMAVFVVQDDIARRTPVAVIDWPAARLIVTDGLAEGARVIRDAEGVSAGQRVRVDAP